MDGMQSKAKAGPMAVFLDEMVKFSENSVSDLDGESVLQILLQALEGFKSSVIAMLLE